MFKTQKEKYDAIEKLFFRGLREGEKIVDNRTETIAKELDLNCDYVEKTINKILKSKKDKMNKPPTLKHIPKDDVEMQKQLASLMILTSVFLTKLDLPNVEKNKQTKDIFDTLKLIEDKLEPILDQFYKSENINKTTFFQEIESKVLYSLDYHVKNAYKKYE